MAEASQRSRTNNGLKAQSCGRQQGSTGEILCLPEPRDRRWEVPPTLRRTLTPAKQEMKPTHQPSNEGVVFVSVPSLR